MNEKKTVRSRNLAVDVVKALAILGVLTIHSCMYVGEIGSANWLSVLFWGTVSRASVPLFFMCSGVLFLNPEREISLKKLYFHNIPRILAAMFVWAFLYKLIDLRSTGFSTMAVLYAVKDVLMFRQDTHFYFLHIILLFYAAVPVVRTFLKGAGRQEVRYALALWFLVGILYPTLRGFWPWNRLTGIPAQWALNMTYASVGYGLLGHFMMTEKPRSTLAYLGGAVLGFCIIFFGTWYLSAGAGALKTGLMEGMSVGVCVLAWGIFGLCRGIGEGGRIPAWLQKVLVYLSRGSFCMFLCHLCILRMLVKRGLNGAMTFGLIAVPLTALTVALCSAAVYEILRRIPAVNRWLI